LAENVGAAGAGRDLGCATTNYPGDDAMQAWRDDGSFEWVGYYLPSTPCHRDASWAGKREQLSQMGWGLAVVYVGQQTWGKTPGKAEVVTKFVKRRVRQVKVRQGRRIVGARPHRRAVSSRVLRAHRERRTHLRGREERL